MDSDLSVERVSFRYGSTWVLLNLTFEVVPGEIVGILGPNASGKTTLVGLLNGVLHPQEGRVLLRGKDVRGLKRREMARRLAVVPQETPMPYAFTALEVVLTGRNPHLRPLRFEGPRDLEIAYRSLARTDCAHVADKNVNELSGGERQRVYIARALAQEPEILLMDEPTVHLDLRHQLEFADLLIRLHEQESITVVWVSHDLNLASMVCQRLLLMKAGKIFAQGSPLEVLTASNIMAVYGRSVIVDRNPQRGTPRVTPLLNGGANR